EETESYVTYMSVGNSFQVGILHEQKLFVLLSTSIRSLLNFRAINIPCFGAATAATTTSTGRQYCSPGNQSRGCRKLCDSGLCHSFHTPKTKNTITHNVKFIRITIAGLDAS
ncbi:MAG: hypothetical protein AAGF55_16980, partial [Pseudomonadota bacterium]